ncbi:ImuA family protein [Maritimibacter sp. 55A14]|uniref:ImuA family protein n=1 Tax=Maritimibacter sp. 55A14 TaxID=2174844 RepID=UPI001E3AC711|nr:hypothetical protein [Maritimibacter sp. 55A14]
MPGLVLARVHEFCGPARRTLALMLARALPGTVVWIRPAWSPDRLNPDGVRGLIDPARLLNVTPKRPEDLLWSMEEVLRSGQVALAVAELPEPPGLTPVRRLQLACETGAAEGAQRPLGVLLLPGAGGAPGVESRWHLAPRHSIAATRWRLERHRARMAPPRTWEVERRGRRLVLRDTATAPA